MFLIFNVKLGVGVLRVLKCMHFVLSMLKEILLATDQLSMLLSSSFALSYKFLWFKFTCLVILVYLSSNHQRIVDDD